MKKNLLITIILTQFCLTGLYAQGVTTAAVSGRVVGAKSVGGVGNSNDGGEYLPGANIVAIHTPSGTTYGTVTQPDGLYTIPNMRVGGPYTITASFIGYRDFNYEGVNLKLGEKFNLSFVLKEESMELEELIVSSGQGNQFSSERTGASTNISNELIQQLPTISRDFNDYIRLTPQSSINSWGGTNFAGRSDSYNNITIDGALFNNSFGLSGKVGGQTNAQPISLDAVDQISTTIAPYDVTQGSFTGAGVNVVTRSGTNDFSGSVYYFTRNQSLVGGKIAEETNKYSDFTFNNLGFRVGGPIIKNKLFFFANFERERKNSPATTFSASRNGSSGATISQADGDELDALSSFLFDQYGYLAGPYENYKLKQNSEKGTLKLDWNINQSNKFSIKYNYLSSFRDVSPSGSASISGRAPSQTGLPFFGAYYRIYNNLNSVIAELNSSFGNSYANKFQIGFTAFRDFRETPTSSIIFPLVDIGNGDGQSFTSFGYEPFSANNKVNSNVFQVSDNFDIYKGKHTITLGTYNEFYQFENGFDPFYFGLYRFNSLSDFYASAGYDPTAGTEVTPESGKINRYLLGYAANKDGTFPLVKVNAFQLGFYAQDKIQVNDKFNLTIGIRADIPVINTPVGRNELASTYSFEGGRIIETDKVQKASVLWSPRIGFNWDVNGNNTTQIRGGSGIFTGRVPYVWISNQASNNGLLFGSIFYSGTSVADMMFSPDVDAYRPTGEEAVSPANNPNESVTYNLAVTDNNFKFPQVWRTNVAIDQKLPAGIIGSLDVAYTKDVNAVYHQNINLPNSKLNLSGADNRPIYYQTFPIDDSNDDEFTRINPKVTDAILMSNTNKGYSYFITAQFKKQFGNYLDVMFAYTYTDAKSVNDGGSIAKSIWRDRQVSGKPNENVLGSFISLAQHRIVSSINYNIDYAKFMSTSFGLFYSLSPSSRFSYTYSGDYNGDGQTRNDLIYVPRDQSEILLTPITDADGVALYSAQDQWNDLDAFIEQDKYLSTRRGKYAERNGAPTPWRGQLDFRVLQNFHFNVGNSRNTIQLSLDIINASNLVNSNWGILQTANRDQLLNFVGYNADGVPKVQFPYLNSGTKTPLTSSYRNSLSLISRWQMQLGIRYIFN